jgi:EAL domain-containing protein (putative c-di-GMP-specific phosphodiesterase class I)
VPILEDLGLMSEVGWWILRQACQEALNWSRNGFHDARIAFNFSPRQFRDPNCLQYVTEIIGEHQDCGHLLTLEVTESHMMEDPARSLEILEEIRKLGVRISVDDFGTGYSSLSLLHRFPIDELKIDRSFVHNLEEDEGAAAIVSAIVLMARTLGITPLAEGVENQQQANRLIELGCPIMQGYLWAPALSAGDLARWRGEFQSG